MTAVGKILVFVNLLFSLVVGGFIIMVYVRQTNWHDGYDKLLQKYNAVAAEADAYRVETQEAREKARADVAAAEKDLKELQGKFADLETKNATLTAALAAAKQQATGGDATVVLTNAEVQRRQDEVAGLNKQIQDSNKKITDLIAEHNKLRERAVAAEIQANSLKATNLKLVDQVEDLGKKLTRLEQGGSGSSSASAMTRNPPLESIEGIITKTDAQSGMVTLSIGSDAGLLKGHTLEVFRLNPAKYLGTLKILEVTPHEAVAKPLTRPLGPIQKGDRVASKILGS